MRDARTGRLITGSIGVHPRYLSSCLQWYQQELYDAVVTASGTRLLWRLSHEVLEGEQRQAAWVVTQTRTPSRTADGQRFQFG